MQQKSWWKSAMVAVLFIFVMAAPVFAEAKNGPVMNEEKGILEYYANDAIDTKFTGIVNYGGGQYYIKNGRGSTTHTALEKVGNDRYYIRNGKVDITYTGLAKNAEGWFYVEDGMVRLDKSGFTSNSKGDWYYENGRVLFNRNDVIKGTIRGEKAWWCVKNNHVKYINSVEKNKNGWWCIKNGKVDFSYTGIAKNKKGWWRIEGGKVNFNFNGIAKNENGYFMIRRGSVDWNYTGIAKYGTSNWYVKRGGVQNKFSGTIKIKNKTYKVKKGKIVSTVSNVSTSGAMDVKAQKYTSATSYLILLDRNRTRVGIYKREGGKWTVAKVFPCCVGARGSQTPTGKFRVGIKGSYFNTGSGGRCWYYTQIRGNVLFHSQIYDRQSAPRRIIDGSMNRWCSHGCVRLYLNDAKWIYNTIPAGTTIVIY